MIALLGRLAYQLIENQFAMLLECAQALFKRKEQRLRQLWGLARVKRVLNDYTLANDLDLQFGDVPVGLGKMLLFLSAIHGFAGNPGGQLQVSKGYKESPGVFPPGLQVECSNLGRLSQMLRRYPKAQITQRATKSLSKKCRS